MTQVMRQTRRPELSELRAFCTAVDLGSLGRAARALKITQPALSKRLRVLETIAGASLLQRSHTGVRPTFQGRVLYVAARRVLAESQALEDLLAAGITNDEAPARVAASPLMAESVLPTMLVEFESRYREHPSVELTIVNSAAVWQLLAEGRADLGLAAASSRSDGSSTTLQFPIYEDEVVVIVPHAHPWASLEEIPAQEFVTTPLVMRGADADSRSVVSNLLHEHGLTLPAAAAETASNAATKAAVLKNGDPGLLSELAIGSGDELAVRRVEGIRFRRQFVLIFGVDSAQSPVAHALIEHIKASAVTA